MVRQFRISDSDAHGVAGLVDDHHVDRRYEISSIAMFGQLGCFERVARRVAIKRRQKTLPFEPTMATTNGSFMPRFRKVLIASVIFAARPIRSGSGLSAIVQYPLEKRPWPAPKAAQ
jgi:hypothetical protein